tara:strand:- start:9 stop:284 length:276 start_codon:yes stop_codon:yes gene_type:complete
MTKNIYILTCLISGLILASCGENTQNKDKVPTVTLEEVLDEVENELIDSASTKAIDSSSVESNNKTIAEKVGCQVKGGSCLANHSCCIPKD